MRIGFQLGILLRQILSPGGQLLLQPVQVQVVLDARQQFLALNRFGDVVHRTETKSLDFVGGVVQCGHEDHRDFGGPRIGFHAPANLEAVRFRHAHVQKHQIGSRQTRFFERLRPAASKHQIKSLLSQEIRYQAQVLRLVVNDQHGCAAQLSCERHRDAFLRSPATA